MVKIRLTRAGRHKLPFYRIVTTDSRKPRDSDYIDLIGTYEPIKGMVKINEEKALKALNNGAQPTETVLSMLKKEGIWKKYQDSKVSKPKAKKATTKKVAAKKVVK